MEKKRRNHIMHSGGDENPMTMLVNLFDVAMVFAVALMVAVVSHFNMNGIFSDDDYTIIRNPGTPEMEVITKKGGKVTRLSASENQNANSDRGERVGTAYRLDNGDIIYVPD